MMLWRYIRKVVGFSFRDFAIRTDIWYAAVSVVVSGTTGPGDVPVAELTPNQIAWYVLMAVGSFALLRLFILAPYRIWKEDQAEIVSAYDRLAAPDFKIESGMADHKIALFKELAHHVAQLSVSMTADALDGEEKEEVHYNAQSRGLSCKRAVEIMYEMAYDIDFLEHADPFKEALLAYFASERATEKHADDIKDGARVLIAYLHRGGY